jgi:hypothetical protein
MGCRLRIAVADLQVGDRTTGSGLTVVSAPTVGARTPPGKVDLTVDYGSGPVRRTWNRRTLIGIERGAYTPPEDDV